MQRVFVSIILRILIVWISIFFCVVVIAFLILYAKVYRMLVNNCFFHRTPEWLKEALQAVTRSQRKEPIFRFFMDHGDAGTR